MKKKIMILFILLLSVSVYSRNMTDEEQINERILKYSEYKNMVTKDREEEIKKNMPSQEEIDLYFQNEYLTLEKEKFNYEKDIAYKNLQENRRQTRLLESALIGGAGYGIYRIGRYYHRW